MASNLNEEKIITLEEFYSKANKTSPTVTYEGSFDSDAEEAFEFIHLPAVVKSKIHYFAYEHGHSAGYSEMANKYSDVVDIAKAAFEAGKKS